MIDGCENLNLDEGNILFELFQAAYKLDINRSEHIVKNYKVDVNSAVKYGHLSLTETEGHSLQIFKSAQYEKVTCQVLEKIDQLQEQDVETVIKLLKLLVHEGLILEEVIFDKTYNEFSVEDSEYFWFTILRKLYVYSWDPDIKEPLQEAYKNLTKYLDESLYRGKCEFGQLARTVRLFVAVEKKDYTTVNDLLEKFPNKSDFITYMKAIPGSIFPRDGYDDDFLITPVTLALRHRDVTMVNIFCSNFYPEIDKEEIKDEKDEKEVFCWGKQPIIKRKISGFSRKMKLSLCLDVLREEEDFFEKTDFLNCQDKFKSTFPFDFTLNVAKLFLATEQNNLQRVKELLKDDAFTFVEIARDSNICSKSIIVCKDDIDKEWVTKLNFEKSLVLTALETVNLEIFEHLDKMGFDITNLGKYTQYPTNSRDRNQFLLWYLLIRYNLQNYNYQFINKICQKSKIFFGPALVGCLCIAAQREDLTTLKLISKYFGSSWFSKAKYKGQTAYSILLKNGLEQKATLLQTYLGSHFTTQSHEDIEKELNKAETIEDFKSLIEENPQWLTQGFTGHLSLLMILVTSEKFSLEKFDFLVREKEADIRMVSTGNKTLLDIMLSSFQTQSGAERLLGVLHYEEAQEVLLITPNFLSDLSTKIVGASDSARNVFLKCFNNVMNLESQTLETLFFPSHIFNFKHKASSIFEVIPHYSELFEIIADKAFHLIGKEEKQLTSLVHLIRVHAKKVYEGGNTTDPSLNPDVKKTLLSLFMVFFDKLQAKSMREQAGFTAALEDWRDRYGMTFIMRVLVDNADVESADSNNPAVDLLIRTIIEEKVFDNEYIDTQAEVALGPQFDLQHRLGIASASKKRNTVISEGQIVEMKRVERLNIETGLYEPILPDKDGQVKMISKKRINVSDDGPERETRVMLTVKKQYQRETFKETTESENSFDLDAVSLDEDESDASKEKQSLDLPKEGLETKINHWNLEDVNSMVSHEATDEMPSLHNSNDNIGTENPQNNLDEIRPRIVEPEHFDKTSILTESKETFMTKENRYKYAPSASTRYVETHSEVESPNKYFAKRTTLLLLACRIKKWSLVESILDNYTPNVNHKDAQGSNALHLTIKASNADMCKNIINRMKKNELKSEVDIDGKTALKLMTEMILNGSAHDEFDYLEEKILKITGQKKNPYRKHTPQVVVDKTKEQKFQLYRGQSCGFSFECLKPPVWTCRGNNCGVEVTLEKDLTFADLNHYSRHACSTEVRVRYKKGKIHIDQFKFECEDESDTDEIEVWSCMAEGCDATIKVDAENQLLIKALGLHNCQPSLKMEVDKNCGILGGHVFWKNPGDAYWYCDDQCCKRAGCKITTVGEGLVLKYPHTQGMHKRKEHRQAAEQVPADEGCAVEDDDDDAGFSGMFE